jgi:hypothetical protein
MWEREGKKFIDSWGSGGRGGGRGCCSIPRISTAMQEKGVPVQYCGVCENLSKEEEMEGYFRSIIF